MIPILLLPVIVFTSRRPLSRLVLGSILTFVTIVTISGANAASEEHQAVVVQQLNESNWDELVPQGKEVDAIYGDLVLQNKHLRAVIAKPDVTRNANMTVRSIGGCLIDLTTREHESDQLSAFYPGRRAYSFAGVKTQIHSAASGSGNEAVVRTGTGSVAVSSPGSDSKPGYTVTWSLSHDSKYLTATSVWENTTASDVTLKLEDDLRADGGKELMKKVADGIHELFWLHDVYWRQAYGIQADGFRIRSNSNARESVLTYEALDGQPIVLKPGQSFTLLRRIFVGQDLPSVLADFDTASDKAKELQAGRVVVMSHQRPVGDAHVQIQCGEVDRGTVVTAADGTAAVRLPDGECVLTVSVAGKKYDPQTVTISDGAWQVNLEQYTSGTATITVVDGEGQAIPAKIAFNGKGETPTPNWGPESAEFFVGNLAYTANGTVSTPLFAGEYEVTVSHGPEYDAKFTTLKIEEGKTTELNVRLPRVISTPGWVSADFHSHSSPSGDNTGSQRGRVLNLVAEHIEFAPCTEHNRISTYDEHIQSLKIQSHLATVSGMELTGQPLPLNHQNVFPLIYRPRTQDGGGPVTDASPETQMERIAAWDNNSIKLIQQNHPDLGWLFYDRNGDQTPDEGYSRTFGIMNVMEIHPIDPLLSPTRFDIRNGKAVENQTALNWLQLLNQGFRIYGVVNTDAHYNFHGSGGLRIWVKSSSDDPARINSDEMRDASRNGHIVMSNGPYLEAAFREAGSDAPAVISGQDLVAKSKKVTASVRVQCPNWLDVDTVMILVNGRRTNELTFSSETHPDLFGKGPVKFDRSIDLELKEDAHLVVLTGHRTQRIGDILGPNWGTQHPTAVSNPVYVDIAGDGFTPNKDTLDIPLPVKFVAEK